MPRLINKMLFILVEYLNADPASITAQLQQLKDDGDTLEVEEEFMVFDSHKWTGFDWGSMVFPATLQALQQFTNKVDPSVTLQVLRRALSALDQVIDSKLGHFIQHQVLISSLKVLPKLADTQQNTADVSELAHQLFIKVESVLINGLLDKQHPVKLRSDLLAEYCQVLNGRNSEVQTQLIYLAQTHLSKVASPTSRRFGVAALVELYSPQSRSELWWSVFEKSLISTSADQKVNDKLVHQSTEVLDDLNGHELALLARLLSKIQLLGSPLVSEFAQKVYSKIATILTSRKLNEARFLIFSLSKEGINSEDLPRDLKIAIHQHFRSELNSPDQYLKNQYQLPLTLLAFSRLIPQTSSEYNSLLQVVLDFCGKLNASEFSNLINKVSDTIIQATNHNSLENSGLGELCPNYVLLYQTALNTHKEKWTTAPGLIAYWMQTWTQLQLRQYLISCEIDNKTSSPGNDAYPLLNAILESLDKLEELASTPETQVILTKTSKLLAPHVVRRFFKEFEEIDVGRDFPQLKGALIVGAKDANVSGKEFPETILEFLENYESIVMLSEHSVDHPSAVNFRENILTAASTKKLFSKLKNELLEHKVTSTNTLNRMHSLLTFSWKFVPTIEQKELEKLRKTGTSFGLLKGFTPKDEAKHNPILTSVSKEELVEIMKLVDKMVVCC